MPFDTPWTLTEPKALPTGEVFCAVRVAREHAQAVLKRLRDFGLEARLGPVLAHNDAAYFLLSPDTGNEPWPGIAHFCGDGAFVTVAPRTEEPAWEGALSWLVPPSQSRRFTDELILRTALEALAERLRSSKPAVPAAQAA